MIPVPCSIFWFYVVDFVKHSKQDYKEILIKFFCITATHFLAAFSVYGLFKLYRIISLPSTKVSGNPQLYGVQDLINKFILRIKQAIYVPFDPFGFYNDNKGFYLLIIPLVVFLLTLIFWRKNTFIKVLILCFLLFIPLYDIFTLFYGGKFQGLVEIRHSYFIVPIICLGMAFVYNVFFLFIESFFNSILKFKTFNYYLSFFVIIIIILSYDLYAQSDFRKKSQMILKSHAEILYNWISQKSSLGKVLIIVKNKKSEDLRLFSVISAYDYLHSSNIIYRIPTTIYHRSERKNHEKDLIHQTDNIDEDTLKSIFMNKTSLGLIYFNEKDFPYSDLIFEKSFFDRMILYSMKPVPVSMTYERYLAYSNFFGNIFVSEWKGKLFKSVPRLISWNPDFKNGIEGWEYWKLSNASGPLRISVTNDGVNSYVKIQGEQVKLWGLTQSLKLKKGGVYKLSGKALTSQKLKTFFGGQVILYNSVSKKEQNITFLHKCNDWTYKEHIFTNDCSGFCSLIIRTGYFSDFNDVGCFTDVKLEELTFTDKNLD